MSLTRSDKNILFSPDPAEDLNDLFTEKTAEYLFLFCNYNPIGLTKSSGYNYSSAVTNRYRILQDTGGFIGNVLRPYVPKKEREFWNDYFQETNKSRSVLSHNNSPANGAIHENTLNSAKEWYDHKKFGEADFERILDVMLEQAEKFRALAESAIKNIPASDSEDVITKCRCGIVDFYCKPTYRDITTGQMMWLLPNGVMQKKENIARIFQYHLSLRDPEACSSDNPFDHQNEYMRIYFRKDLENFLEHYITEDGATLLPYGLIQEFGNTLIYPVRNGMVEKIHLSIEDYTKVNDEMGVFKTNTPISNIPLNVTVSVFNTGPEYIDSLVNTKDGVPCRAFSDIYIGDIVEKGKEVIFTV